MIKYTLAAAALTISTSAFAWTPDSKMDADLGMNSAPETKIAGSGAKSDQDWQELGGAKAETASWEMADKSIGDEAKLASLNGDAGKSPGDAKWDWSSEVGAKLASSDSSWSKAPSADAKMASSGANLGKSSDQSAMKGDFVGKSDMALAAGSTGKAVDANSGTKARTASLDKSTAKMPSQDMNAEVQTAAKTVDSGAHTEMTGMGGPLEEIATNGAAATTPQPAAKGYEPCAPGRGDDNCIQLYEPGVKAALAQWTSPGGGLWNGDMTASATAMGGPYEPVGKDEGVSKPS